MFSAHRRPAAQEPRPGARKAARAKKAARVRRPANTGEVGEVKVDVVSLQIGKKLDDVRGYFNGSLENGATENSQLHRSGSAST